jgi:hypothetical protein
VLQYSTVPGTPEKPLFLRTSREFCTGWEEGDKE